MENFPYLAVAVAAVAHFIVGMLWYSPLLFGKAWMKAAGITQTDMEAAKAKGMAGTMVVSLILSIVVAVVLNYLQDVTQAQGVMDAAIISTIVWVGFVATNNMSGVLWENDSKVKYLINTFYSLAAYLASGIVLILM